MSGSLIAWRNRPIVGPKAAGGIMSVATVKIDETIAALRALLGERLSTSRAILERHGKDETFHAAYPPDAVAFARSVEEVAEIVKICAANRTPIIPYGTGTSLEGHIAALQGGVCIDVSQMDKVLKVNPEDLDVTVQPGVTRKQLNEHLRDLGLFFPIDPGANASLGGMTATRASGTNAVRYGTMRENVLALQVVLPDGRIVRTARRSKKSSAGYDLTRLFIGSEGTLGVITEITLRLYGIPEAVSAAVCSFDTLEGAVNTTIATIQSGVPVARIELLDDVQMDAVNRYSKLNYPPKHTLFLEFHGSEASVREQAEAVQAIAADNDGGQFQFTLQAEERTRLWQARHDAAYAAKALRTACEIWATDVCVPISRLAECILETRKELDEAKVVAPIVGHVGDGNFHVAFVIDTKNPAEIELAEHLNEKIVMRALAMDGTCTGEHGVGYGKMQFLLAEHGGDAISIMRGIKKSIDPQNIMNPGKIFTQ
jgi:D-lactate dehydrogenase (cytochrome)